MSESVAIATYVANAYDKKGELYPKDPKVRGRVEQVIYFNEGVFYATFGNTVVSKWRTEDFFSDYQRVGLILCQSDSDSKWNSCITLVTL